jgi:hypothetical protein
MQGLTYEEAHAAACSDPNSTEFNCDRSMPIGSVIGIVVVSIGIVVLGVMLIRKRFSKNNVYGWKSER